MSNENPQLEDFRRNPPYERRAVVFCDVLGWRTHIGDAGQDAVKLGNLRRLILRQSRALSLRSELKLRTTTFSDNIVLSQDLDGSIGALAFQVCLFQFAGALNHFLLRGGITIGELLHDTEVVFGPALNRAYELESAIARVPRIMVDHHVVPVLKDTGFVAEEDGFHFLDPFTVKFCEDVQRRARFMDVQDTVQKTLEAGLPAFRIEYLDRLSPDQILTMVLDVLIEKLKTPLPEKDFEKVAWLHDRIANQLHMPHATTYRS